MMALLHMAGLENSECIWKIQRKPEVFITISMLYKVKVSLRWKVLFFHSIDIMIVNAFIVFQEFKKENPQSLIIYLYILVSWNSENLL
jgi:hypothetical protein